MGANNSGITICAFDAVLILGRDCCRRAGSLRYAPMWIGCRKWRQLNFAHSVCKMFAPGHTELLRKSRSDPLLSYTSKSLLDSPLLVTLIFILLYRVRAPALPGYPSNTRASIPVVGRSRHPGE